MHAKVYVFIALCIPGTNTKCKNERREGKVDKPILVISCHSWFGLCEIQLTILKLTNAVQFRVQSTAPFYTQVVTILLTW